jgi:hypothetical protein
MLDLDARIHLHEVVRTVFIEQHLDRSRADVVDSLGAGHGGIAHLETHRRRHGRTRRLFDQLLVATLHRAIALAQMDQMAVLVADDLEFDVPWPGEILLDVHVAVAERRQRLGPRKLEGPREIVRVSGDAHALAAAAGRGLDDHGKADLLGEDERFVNVVDGTGRARNDRHADGGHGFPRRRLVTHHADLIGRGSDEGDLRRRADIGEFRVLGQESVAGMDRVGAGDLGRGDQARNVEVRFARRRGPDADVVVGEAHVQRLAIGLGVDSDRLDAQLAARADDAQRDFSAIGDENFVEHYFAVESPSKPDQEVSLVPATPWTRRANSAGLVA